MRRSSSAFLADEHGTVVVEYALVLALLAAGACAAIATLAALLLRLFAYQQALILQPFP